MKKQNFVKNLVLMSILLAAEIVLGRLLSIRTPFITVSFSFVALGIAGRLFGPGASALIGGLSDLIGALLFPIGAYFPGFTFNAALNGAIYGWMFYKKPFQWRRVLIGTFVQGFVISLFLGTVWISVINGKLSEIVLPARLLKSFILMIIKCFVFYELDKVNFERLKDGAS